MKVARRISDKMISYVQDPDFEKDKGIINSIVLFGGKRENYEEIDMNKEEIDSLQILVPMGKTNETISF